MGTFVRAFSGLVVNDNNKKMQCNDKTTQKTWNVIFGILQWIFKCENQKWKASRTVRCGESTPTAEATQTKWGQNKDHKLHHKFNLCANTSELTHTHIHTHTFKYTFGQTLEYYVVSRGRLSLHNTQTCWRWQFEIRNSHFCQKTTTTIYHCNGTQQVVEMLREIFVCHKFIYQYGIRCLPRRLWASYVRAWMSLYFSHCVQTEKKNIFWLENEFSSTLVIGIHSRTHGKHVCNIRSAKRCLVLMLKRESLTTTE